MKNLKCLLLLLAVVMSSHTAIAQSIAVNRKESIWQDFRNKYPNNFQTIGVGKFDDNSVLFLISEPAPHVKLDDVKKIFEGTNATFEIKQWKIGYDGWVKDILIPVSNLSKETEAKHIDELNKLMYFTAYKSSHTTLPVKRPRKIFADSKLNYNFSGAEIEKNFIIDNKLFFNPKDENKKFSIKTILQNQIKGVFFCESANYVIWSLPKGDISSRKEDIRQFALDADVILGAISNENMLVVIGRERKTTLSELPPLRTEMIGILASTTETELSQSLDILDLLCGRMSNGKDWCPAYLSKMLENTEFGHLLTLTDIALKDWSELGSLTYNEYRYEKPKHYPFKQHLIEKFGVGQIVYNWNAENMSDESSIGNNIKVYAISKTGALPISYFNSQTDKVSISKNDENIAYEYFANLNNTDMARAVQYTFLYRIFKANNVKLVIEKPSSIDKSALLVNDVKNTLNRIKQLSDIEINNISRRIAEDYYEKYLKVEHQRAINQTIDESKKQWNIEIENEAKKIAQENSMSIYQLKNTPEYISWLREEKEHFEKQMQISINNATIETMDAAQNEVKKQIVSLKNEILSVAPSNFDKLCKYIAYPRGEYTIDYQSIANKAIKIANLANQVKYGFEHLGIDIEAIKDKYVASLTNDSERWVKTPKVVIITNNMEIKIDGNISLAGMGMGGHNISSKIPRKTIDRSVPIRNMDEIVGIAINQQRGYSSIYEP